MDNKPSYFPLPAFLREKQILFGDKNIGLPQLMPIARSAWWIGVKTGLYPKPVKLSSKTTVWRGPDIEKLILSHYK